MTVTFVTSYMLMRKLGKTFTPMTREQQLQYCKVCSNRYFDPASGIVCKLTMKKAEFLDKCEKFIVDNEAVKAIKRQLEQSKQRQDEYRTKVFDYKEIGINFGVFGGILMLIIGIVWFWGGLVNGNFSFEPLMLTIFGIIALLKGIYDKNIAGENSE